MNVDKVTEMRVTLANQTMVATYAGGKWQLNQPINDLANADAVRNVIQMFSSIASDEPVSNPGAASQYGLDKPFAKAVFTEDGKKKEFTIGREGRTNVFYVKTSQSSNLYLVRGLSEELLALRPIDLVNSQLLAFDPAEVVAIKATAKDGTETVERSVKLRDGRWFTATGATGIVFDVDLLLRDLRYVNVADVPSGQGSGLSPGATMHLEMTLQNGTKKTLDVGNKVGDQRLYYVKSSDRPRTYAVAEFIAQNLRDKLRMVGTDMMGLDADRTVGLLINSPAPDGTTTERKFTKDKDGWTSEGKVAFSVSGVMDSIVGVSAVSFAPDSNDANYGFMPAAGSYKITATLNNKATITLDLGSPAPDGVNRYVKSSSRQGVYLAPATSMDHILAALSRVRSDLMVFEPATVTRITYMESNWSGRTTSKSVIKQGSRWTLDGQNRDAARVDKFLTLLRGLGADKVAPEMEDAAYGFYPAADTQRIELTFNDGRKLTLDKGGFITEGSGWFAITSYYVRISDLTDVVLIGEFEIGDVFDALKAFM